MEGRGGGKENEIAKRDEVAEKIAGAREKDVEATMFSFPRTSVSLHYKLEI